MNRVKNGMERSLIEDHHEVEDPRQTIFQRRQSVAERRFEKKISFLNMLTKIWTVISLEDAMAYPHRMTEEPFIIFFRNLSNNDISKVRKAYKLHPVIDNECSPSVFNVKDQMLTFNDYILLTISDLNYSNGLEHPVSMKLIYFKNFILIFCKEPLYCLDKVSKDENFDSARLSDSMESSDPSEAFMDRTTKKIRIDIGNEYGCSDIETILHKLLEALFHRLEWFILDFEKKSKSCVETATDLTVGERVEFIQKLSLTEQSLIYLKNLLKPKQGLLEDLRKSRIIGTNVKCYFDSMTSRMKSMYQRLQTASYMLQTAEHIYTASVEETLTNYSNRLNDIMKQFSSIATIFLPLNLIAGLFGMNVQVPMQEYDSLWPFSAICGVCVCLFFFVILYFKNKDWL